MERINVETGDTPEIQITRIAGSLQIKGWSEDSVRIEVSHQEDLNYTFHNDTLVLSTQGNCELRVPEAAELSIGSVGGNAYVSEMESDTKIETISGSLSLKNMGSTSVGQVSGNLNVRGIEGDLTFEKVLGNASLRDIEGDLQANDVQSNLSLRDIEGDVVGRSRGNADLRIAPEGNVQVEAQGNLFCYFEEDSDADVKLHSGSHSIKVDTADGRQAIDSESYEFKLGDGGTDVRLSAAGDVTFRSGGKAGDLGFDLDSDFIDEMADLADEVSEQVGAAMGPQIEALNERLTELGNRLRNSGSRAAHVAQRRVEKAQRKLERKMQGRHGRVIVTSAVKPSEPVSADERALILQMVQDKKITVAEAEMLLNTLEGRKPASQKKAEPEATAAPEGKQEEGGNA